MHSEAFQVPQQVGLVPELQLLQSGGGWTTAAPRAMSIRFWNTRNGDDLSVLPPVLLCNVANMGSLEEV